MHDLEIVSFLVTIFPGWISKNELILSIFFFVRQTRLVRRMGLTYETGMFSINKRISKSKKKKKKNIQNFTIYFHLLKKKR